MTEELATERLLLRRWRESDRAPFRAMNADPRVMEFMPRLLDADASDGLIARFEGHFEQHGFGLFAAQLRRDGGFLGFIGISVPGFAAPFMPSVEIGWRLAPRYWGRGLATEGAREVLRHAFEVLRLPEIVSFTVPGNVRSRRVMERLGMRHDPGGDFEHPGLPEGHAMRRHVLYRLRAEEWSDPRSRPG